MSCTPQMVSMERKTRVTVHTNVPHAEPPNRFPRHPLERHEGRHAAEVGPI